MKITYVGMQITGFNREPDENESFIEVSPHDLVHGMVFDAYKVVSNVLVPMTPVEMDNAIQATAKSMAFERKLAEIDQLNQAANLQNFTYDGHEYFADVASLSVIEGNCHTKMYLGTPDTDPVPAPGGKWKSADTEADGLTPIYVALSIAEFLLLTDTLTTRGIVNFGVKETHKNAVKTMYLNTGITAEDLDAYDASSGWQ